MTKQISILGAGGFIGLKLMAALSERGHRMAGGVRSLPELSLSRTSWLERDYARPEDYERLLDDADALVHCASSSTVSSSSSHPVHEFDSDLRTSLALIEALQGRKDIHVVYLSSGGTVYGQSKDQTAIREDSALKPQSYHGASKLSVEHFLMAWAMQSGAKLSIIRPSNIFGPGQHFVEGFGVVPTLFRAVRKQSIFAARGSLDSVRDYLYIDDLINLLIPMIESPTHDRIVTLNAGSGVGTTLRKLIQTVETVCNHKLKIANQMALDGEINSVVLDSTLSSSLYNWNPKVSLQRGLEATWDWWKNAK